MDDRRVAERVLATTTAAAREILGERLSAVFALGSLAHGGFAPRASDIDVALIVDDLAEDTAALVARVRRTAVVRSGTPLAERLSVFWSDWPGVRHGAGAGARLPAVDRLDLLDDGRLLHGTDLRAGADRPGHSDLVLDGARFACRKFDDAYLDRLHRPGEIAAAGPRVATKIALFPIRFLYTLGTGRIGHNADAARWYERSGAHPALAAAAMAWRANGVQDVADATRVLREGLVGVHDEFLDAYAAALSAEGVMVEELAGRRRQLHRT